MKPNFTATGILLFVCSFFIVGPTFFNALPAGSGGLVPSAQAQVHENDEGERASCSLRTLKGSYGTTYHGTVFDFPNPGQNPIGIVAKITYDGAGHLVQLDTVSISGQLTAQRRSASGTYTLNRDCTGSQQIVFPDGFVSDNDIVTVNHGKEILGITTNGGFTITFDSKKQ